MVDSPPHQPHKKERTDGTLRSRCADEGITYGLAPPPRENEGEGALGWEPAVRLDGERERRVPVEKLRETRHLRQRRSIQLSIAVPRRTR